MATLGELLFYMATQQQDSGAASVAEVSAVWGINESTVAGVAALLRRGEDAIAQHYAVKTVENICSQPGEWAAKFAVPVRGSPVHRGGQAWAGTGVAKPFAIRLCSAPCARAATPGAA